MMRTGVLQRQKQQSVQLNRDILEIFEIAWKGVQVLKSWDILWDYDPDDINMD
jgi:hypothetical protein